MRKRWLPIAVFGLALAAGIAWSQSLGDPFDGERFQNPNWEWENEPAQWDVGKTKPGWLHIVADPNRNLWQAYTTSHLYQEHSGDFDVATHLIAEYAANSIVAGLVAYSPTTQDHQGRDGQWVTIKLWGRAADAILQFQKRELESGGGLLGQVPGFVAPAAEPVEVYLRLKREGDLFTAWYKLDAAEDWTHISETQEALNDPIRVGLYAGIDAAAGQMTADYEYFEDLLVPFAVSPEGRLPVFWGRLKTSRSKLGP